MGEAIQVFQVEADALCKIFVQGNVRGEWRVVSGAGMVVCEHRITNLSLFAWVFFGFSTPPPTKQTGTLVTLCEIWFGRGGEAGGWGRGKEIHRVSLLSCC